MSGAQTAQQILFQNSLAEVVRLLRANKNKEREITEKCLQEIKSELRSSAQMVKVTAVVKLTYFSMLGYNGDMGAFNIIEVMADPLFHNKRVGYVAAAVIFHEGLDLLPLITAQVKKDLLSSNQYEIGLALYCLSCVCTPDLAKDLVSDVVGLLNHQRSYVRKKAVLCLYKIFLQFPDALRPVYPKLKEKIDDQSDKADNDPSVRGAVVNVLCELARRNPGNFLNLVVPFFSLLNTVHNNWTLIKIIKVFGHFAPLEPRLGKKLVDPITNLITTSPAKSVQYECIYAVANGMSKVPGLTKLAADKMKLFAEDSDQNLKYLGLDAMSRIIIENPKLLVDQRETVLSCLDDADNTIRIKALGLLQGLTTKKNLAVTVNAMFDRIERFPPDEDWSNLVIEKIIETARDEDYELITDFEWYCGVLLDLGMIQLSNFKHGRLISEELVTITTRVNGIRPYAVESLAVLLTSEQLLTCEVDKGSTQWLILNAAAFLAGEFPHWLPNKLDTVKALLSDRISHLPAELQNLCVTAAGKIHAFMTHPCDRHVNLVEGEEEGNLPEDATKIEDITALLLPPAPKDNEPLVGLAIFCHSPFPDVQEKAQFVKHIVEHSAGEAYLFFNSEFTAVAEGAQKHVAVPADLDLDTPFGDMPALIDAVSGDEYEDSEDDDTSSEDDGANLAKAEAVARSEKARRTQVDAYYLRESSGSPNVKEEDLPPVETLPTTGNRRSHRATAGGKTHTINKTLAGPQGFVPQAAGQARRSKSPVEDEATKRLRNINVGGKLGKEDVLPVVQPYKRVDPTQSSSPKGSPDRASDAFYQEEEAAGAPPLYDGEHLSLALDFSVCHAKRDVLTITLNCRITNKKESHSMYNPTLAVDEGCDPSIKIANAADASSTSVIIAEKVKGNSTVTGEVTLAFENGILFTEVPLKVTFVAEKRERIVNFTWTPKFAYILKPVENMNSKDFNDEVLGNMKEAACLSADIKLPKKVKPADAIRLICEQVGLTAIDTVKDAVSLYGRLVIKKSAAAKGHVAVLVVSTSPKVLTIYSKSHQTNIAEQIIQEIANALA
jgi:AP-3 complex subunit delta-1